MSTKFKNRISENPNRKKLVIVSQTPNEIIADLYRADTNVAQQGDTINAEVLNQFQDEINTSNTNANNAVTTASNAKQIASEAKHNADEALKVSTEASQNANEAIVIAKDVENALADRGTTVYFGLSAQSTITFISDPQEQIDLKVSRSEIFDLIYPVGSIYMSINSANPSSIFGGTWTSWGNGRVPLGMGNNGETNYTTIEEIGGSENSVALHTHTQNAHTHTQNEHSHLLYSGNDYSSSVGGLKRGSNKNQIGAVDGGSSDLGYVELSHNGSNWVSLETPEINLTTAINDYYGVTGGNRMPYITCYMWKRVA